MQRVHRIIVLTLFLVSGLLASADTGAAQESPVLDRVVQTGELRVGMSGSQPPFNVREVDMVISGMTITAERSQRVSFVGPYMLSGMSILTNSRSLSMIDETEDFDQANLKLAALRNSTSQRFIERHLPAAQFTAVEDYDAGVQMVLSDEVDALVADMPICLLTVLRFPDAGLLTLDAPLTIEPIGMAVPKGDMQFRNVVENYYRAMQGTGILEALREKWMEDGSWIAALP
jgi:polar amino acid transport system substrate-binding protein